MSHNSKECRAITVKQEIKGLTRQSSNSWPDKRAWPVFRSSSRIHEMHVSLIW